MKKTSKRLLVKVLSKISLLCLGWFSVFRYTGFSLCLFGEPEYIEEDNKKTK